MRNIRLHKVALIASSILASTATYADDSADISVSMTITPTACDITVDTASFDFGVLTNSNLADSGATELSELSSTVAANITPATFTVACGGPVSVGFSVDDNAEGGVDSDAIDNSFGLGLGYGIDDTTAATPIGYYILSVADWTGDSITLSGSTQSRASDADDWADVTDSIVLADGYTYSNADLVSTPASDVTFSLEPTIYLNGQDKLSTDETHTVAGSYTVNVIF
jgi:type 1 fimbria pilin